MVNANWIDQDEVLKLDAFINVAKMIDKKLQE
jgi:hypothetical protein